MTWGYNQIVDTFYKHFSLRLDCCPAIYVLFLKRDFHIDLVKGKRKFVDAFVCSCFGKICVNEETNFCKDESCDSVSPNNRYLFHNEKV